VDDRVAIVTGGSTGIGRAIARRLGVEGCAVVVNSKSDTRGGAQTVSEIETGGGVAIYVQADVATQVGASTVLAAAAERFGRTDILVNNAGATRSASIGDWTEEHWRDMLDTNLLSTALMCQTFVGSEPASGAHIVNLASIRGLPSSARIGAAAYCAAKAGVIALTAALARATAPGITVNAISPGFVETDYMTRADQELRQQWLAAMPIGRFIDPNEIAAMVVFLVGQSAITGANLIADGAWTITAN
jgi:NAD(P)-dependent dehydrogenase (short-subunit alcohol dehydrogenase family)